MLNRKNITISRATVKDAHDIAKMAIQMWEENTIDGLAEEFKEMIEEAEGVVFLAKVDGQAAGFAQCQLRHDYVEGTDSSPVGYLEGIFVQEEYRGCGIAKHLLQECEKWAVKQGCTEFASDCELTNSESLKFHMSMGFEEANRIICFTKRL
ncbi:MAG: GNAT family N-acetyltransferase [Lachnospiraceae bacterium]|nr:GNAT family N-acetyltransferase [Lachnospiraceae bacterium]